MAQQSLAIRIGNPLMKFFLRSPLHKVASASIMLITVTGRKTGKIGVFEFITAQAFGIKVGKSGIAAFIAPQPAGKTPVGKPVCQTARSQIGMAA